MSDQLPIEGRASLSEYSHDIRPWHGRTRSTVSAAAHLMLDRSGVEQALPDGSRTLYDLLLRVRGGEFVSVVGHLDGGKSTVLRRASRFEVPSFVYVAPIRTGDVVQNQRCCRGEGGLPARRVHPQGQRLHY
jgi:hypothetical protein